MPTTLVFTDVQAIAPAGVFDIRPNAGEDWKIRLLGDSLQVGVPPNQVPNIDVAFIDAAGNGPSNLMRSVDLCGWYREQAIAISRNNGYLRLTNNGLACNVAYSAELIREYGAGSSIVRSDVQPIASLAALRVQPPPGEDWVVTAIGSDQWIGALPAGQPNVRVDMMDGTDTAIMMQSTEARYWENPLEIYVTNGLWIDIVNTSLVQAEISFSAEVIRDYGAGSSIVRSRLIQAGALGVANFQPPPGENWKVTGFGAANWFGVSPLMNPDIDLGMWDGVLNAQISDRANWRGQGHRIEPVVNNTHYLQGTDTSNAINDIGISARLIRTYA